MLIMIIITQVTAALLILIKILYKYIVKQWDTFQNNYCE